MAVSMMTANTLCVCDWDSVIVNVRTMSCHDDTHNDDAAADDDNDDYDDDDHDDEDDDINAHHRIGEGWQYKLVDLNSEWGWYT